MKRASCAWSLAAALLGLVTSVHGARAAETGKPTLRVFAAASLSGAFGEIARAFERQHPGASVQLNFAGSQQLASQIEQGAQADVFASADDRWMDHVRARGEIAAPARTFARNRMVFVIPRTNPGRIRRLQDLGKGGLKIVIGADAVPVGLYTRAVLANLSRDPAFGSAFSTRVLANVVSQEENVKSIVGKVQLGEADAGAVYRSDVTPALGAYVRTLEIPEAANVMASYPIATLGSAPNPELAKAFVDLVLSSEGQRILSKWGFLSPTPASP